MFDLRMSQIRMGFMGGNDNEKEKENRITSVAKQGQEGKSWTGQFGRWMLEGKTY